ncbi:MAG: hypothetical protein QM503_02580, partial [Bacteroidota bacterium]
GVGTEPTYRLQKYNWYETTTNGKHVYLPKLPNAGGEAAQLILIPTITPNYQYNLFLFPLLFVEKYF